MHKPKGFTIVELLIVIVVIAILATLSFVAYENVSAKARDSQRDQDISTIIRALDLYYADNGMYPISSGSGYINDSWSSSADASWQNIAVQLKPYIDQLPVDPINDGAGMSLGPSGFGYSYFSNTQANLYCGASGVGQFFIIVYRREGSEQKNKTVGHCDPSNSLTYSSSWYRVVK